MKFFHYTNIAMAGYHLALAIDMACENKAFLTLAAMGALIAHALGAYVLRPTKDWR